MYRFIDGRLQIEKEKFDELGDKISHILWDRMEHHPVPQTLFHDTTIESFTDIINSGRLRGSHIAYIRDKSEHLHALKIFAKALKKYPKKGLDADARGFLQFLASQAERAKIAADDYPPIFVFCFSDLENDARRWRARGGRDGGISIGFDLRHLRQYAHQFFIAPVVYRPEKQLKIAEALIDITLRCYFNHITTGAPDDERHVRSWVKAWRFWAARVAPLIKRPTFQGEREWRLIYIPNALSEIDFRPTPRLLAPYVESDLSGLGRSEQAEGRRLPINQIRIGPGRLSDLSRIAVQDFLLKHHYATDKIRFETAGIAARFG